MLKRIKNIPWGYIVVAALTIAIGVLFVAFNNTFTVLAITIGAILAISGIAFGVIALLDKKRGLGFALRVVLSVIMLVGGITTMIANDAAVLVIADVFCLLLIVDASFKLHDVTNVRSFRNPIWWGVLILSVAIITASFIFTKLSGVSAETFSILFGVIMILDGILNAMRPLIGTKKEPSQSA